MRDLQNEVTIEEIIRERSLKVFEERCRHYYKPPKTVWLFHILGNVLARQNSLKVADVLFHKGNADVISL